MLHSDDFVTTFFVGFSNDSQTWTMYTNGYEEMVGARELLCSYPLDQGGLSGEAEHYTEACFSLDLPWECGQGHPCLE